MPTTKEELNETCQAEHKVNQKNLANVNKTQWNGVLKHLNLQTNIMSIKLF
ncbi:MAG TPA: hypothetical protein VIZ21_05855 [Ignavibacteriaceae bacterium]